MPPDDFGKNSEAFSSWCDPLPGRRLLLSCFERNHSRRGFFKCSGLWKQAWDTPTNESESAEFTIDEVLNLKPGEIRIGLDFSPTMGTFAVS